MYERFPEMQGKTIDVWPVGIDVDAWRPEYTISEKLDCFVYFKNREDKELSALTKTLGDLNLKYELLKYGHYQEEELKSLCRRSKFAILLTGTESQGIAYMNILSTNTPCLVLNKSTWHYEGNGPRVSAPATSVPYFDERCGWIIEKNSLLHNSLDSTIRHFAHYVEEKSFSPRDYITEHHQYEDAARKYWELIVKAHKRKF